ncbi:hypothetical protein L1987_83990 [Smallanthus sonchifolius]|uniref:Uncharacterized protein n=1 Tax=Smallanthus sonchifolius TaxID=185202 RepID=A0ACB8YE68_9ASTR|nr:hypothetical protein L1987_83990 [Smallanthus sonchifolius]
MRINPLLLPRCSSNQLAQIKALVLTSSQPHALNTLLASLVNSRTPQHAFALYNQMLHNPFTHNHFTFNNAIKACCFTNSFNKDQEIHARVTKSGHFSHTYIQNSFIHFYVLKNDIVYAYRVFQTIVSPDVISWTSIISGFSKCGFEDKAIRIFSVMSVNPNANTLVSVLSACCCTVGGLKLGKSVHCYWLKRFDQRNVILDNALLHLYVTVGCLEYASQVFDKMPERNVVSWTAMVGGLVRRGFCEDAISVFNEMVEEGEL